MIFDLLKTQFCFLHEAGALIGQQVRNISKAWSHRHRALIQAQSQPSPAAWGQPSFLRASVSPHTKSKHLTSQG